MAEMNFGAQERERRDDRLGFVTLQVTEFDQEKNSITGVDPNGEVMTVRLATQAEFADMYVNRNVHGTEEARMAHAKKSLARRPDAKKVETFFNAGDDGVLGAVQISDVRKVGNGDLVGRWPKSLSTEPSDTHLQAQVRINRPRSNAETQGGTNRRKVDMVLPDTATSPTMDVLNEMTQNRVTGADGRQLDGMINSAVMVGVEDVRNGSTGGSFVLSPWDKDVKQFASGADAILDRPLNKFSWQTVVPLAAAVGKPFEELKFDERLPADIRNEAAADLYAETQAGNIKVAVAQGFKAEIMPEQVKDILRLEDLARESDGGKAQMTDRGFFSADVSFRSRESSDPQYADSVSVKDILETEYLVPQASDSYSPKKIHSMGADVVASAEASGSQLTMEAAPTAAPEPENKPKSGVAMSADMSGM